MSDSTWGAFPGLHTASLSCVSKANRPETPELISLTTPFVPEHSLSQKQYSFLTDVLPGMFAITEPLTLFPLAAANFALAVCASLLVYILIVALGLAQVSQVPWLCAHFFTLSKV